MCERWVKATIPGGDGQPDDVIAINMAHVRYLQRIGEITLVTIGGHHEVARSSVTQDTASGGQSHQLAELRPDQLVVREELDHFLPGA